jgi:hypothetical protein
MVNTQEWHKLWIWQICALMQATTSTAWSIRQSHWKDLSRRELNGSRGHCGGFDATTGRLLIYLFGVDGTMSKKPILVKVNNLVGSSSTGGSTSSQIGDFFWLKVTLHPEAYILCYDNSKSCCFVIFDDSREYRETFDLVSLAHNNNKQFDNNVPVIVKSLHFIASFIENGVCKIYPRSAQVRTGFWAYNECAIVKSLSFWELPERCIRYSHQREDVLWHASV